MLLPNADIDYIQRRLATEQAPYELPMLEDMAIRLSAGDLVVDAGANIGNHTMYLAAVVGCKVTAFEPNAALAAALCTSLDLNALNGQVDVRRLGLGRHAGRGQFVEAIPDNLGAQSIASGAGPLEIVALDSIAFPAQVKALKIDVEGMELDVLDGASGLISRDRPLLYVECSDQTGFHQVHQWMSSNDYGYWDTFNATPTHLFLPNEQTTVEQRVARLQLKSVQDIYALREQIGKSRAMLDGANLKYRAANEQIAALKTRLSQQEAARDKAEDAARDAGAQLARTRDRLAAERSSLQQDVNRLSVLAASHQETAHQTEQQLGRIKTQLKAETEALALANGRYREAVTQAAALNRRLVHEEQAARGAEKLWGEAQADIHRLQTGLGKETASHQAAIAKIRELNTMIASEVGARRQVELREQQACAHLAQVRQDYELANEEISQLKERIRSSQEQAQEQQRDFEQMKLELATHKRTLNEVRQLLERVRQQKSQAEQQVIKTRASLSFQLGYILINGLKSVRGFVGMPGALLAWRRDAIRRRKQKAQRLAKLQVAVARAARLPPAPKPSVAQAVTPAATACDLRRLKVACIMDEFTFESYRAECELFQLTPAAWQSEVEQFKPELLFIESAWRGKAELWGSKVGHNSQELQGIVAWCRRHGVPTVFWNKEDPVHFDTFLSTAMLFDCVFTTDIDCIHHYKAALGHDKVFLLPFACQPRNNHPIETYARKEAFCFAGAYYVRYPERTRDLGNFISELPGFRPVEIYDRNFGKMDPNHQFPPEYRQFIVGTLPFDQIDKAYKGYRYAINLNSIKQSQTMFARRVFELMASNTITVSNFSRGIRLMFGDLVIATDNGHEMVRRLGAVAGDEAHGARLRLAALRKVLQEHTYEQRLAYVFSKVSGRLAPRRQPKIAVLARADSRSQLELLLANVARQTYPDCQVHVMLATSVEPAQAPDPRLRFLSQGEAERLDIATIARDADFVAGMVAQDYYGPNYLLDIALATSYSDAELIGKRAHYAWENGAIALQAGRTAYSPADRLALRSAAVRLARVAKEKVSTWLAALESATLDTQHGLAIDEFNYCRQLESGADCERVSATVDDLRGLDTGVPIAQLLHLAECIPPAAPAVDTPNCISGKHLAEAFGKAPSLAVRLDFDGDHWCFHSSLDDGKHEYLYATSDFPLAALGLADKAEFYLDITPGLNLQLVLVFLDAQKQKISHVIKHANRNQDADIPLGAASVRLGLRIYAGGSAGIKNLVLGHRDLQPAEIVGKADRLVVTNHYPSYDDLYRNGFVHSRVLAYRERGIRSDVFRLRPREPISCHEFEDVDVTTGSQEVLHQMLSSGRYKTVMVHFLEPAMWEVLQQHIDRIKLVVWVHGAEIQPWHRRDYNYSTEEERSVARMKSDARMAFWHGVLRPMPANLKLVFVSRYFAEEVMEDLGFRIPETHYTIIHNPIDTEVFDFEAKPAEQRKKVLSIRPYASAKYANDLSVKAIQLLAEKPWFHEMEFRMIGDGPLFEATLEPLRQFRNVFIERRFLTQSEIATLHKEYGVFLSPTRMDAQGVSRDEAMSSGLVPVTNGVTAIPEFVDERCGILAPGEDALALAEGMAALYQNAELFLAMSEQARRRVERQSAKHAIVSAELEIME